jgi:hypothetical protein
MLLRLHNVTGMKQHNQSSTVGRLKIDQPDRDNAGKRATLM